MAYIERSKCCKCGKVRYRKYMKESGFVDGRSGLTIWQCKNNCTTTYKYNQETQPSTIRNYQLDLK